MKRSIWLGTLIATIIVLALIVALAGTGTSSAVPIAVVQPFSIPTLAAVLLSALGGAVLGGAFVLGQPPPGKLRDLGYASLLSIACVGGALLLLAGEQRHEIGAAKAGIAFILAVLALAAGIRCIDLLGKGHPIGFESYWGGLGGGGGGWQILPPTGLVILALALTLGAVALVTSTPSVSNAAEKAGGTAGGAPQVGNSGAPSNGNGVPARTGTIVPASQGNSSR